MKQDLKQHPFGFALAVALGLAIGAACPQPLPPVPPGPVPVEPDAGADVFTGAVVDCALAASPAPLGEVTDCLDVVNTGPCLVSLTGRHTPDTVACSVRALTMSLHVEMARGAASDDQARQAAAADAWIRSRQIGYR
jgi:hypothetical protein